MDHTPEHTAQQIREREVERRRREGKPIDPPRGHDQDALHPSPDSVAGQQGETLKDAAEGDEPA